MLHYSKNKKVPLAPHVASRKEVSPFTNEAFAKIGRSATKAVLNSRLAPSYHAFRIPRMSSEVLQAKLDPSCFASDGIKEEENKETLKKAPAATAETSACAQLYEDDSDTSSSSSSSSDSEDDSTTFSDEETNGTVIFQSNGYIVNQMKKSIAAKKLADKEEATRPPLFSKTLEMCAASLQYLDEKCDVVNGEKMRKVIKQSRQEYEKNMKAFRHIRRKDFERRRQRKEQRREAFRVEREMEAELEAKETKQEHQLSKLDGQDEKPILVESEPINLTSCDKK